ncbi:MAG TPA: hypothetical protein VJN43_02855 [Bryobacteraceae bacterium]|nr:hypothetical protein [Bryobacteraceae bacterium]
MHRYRDCSMIGLERSELEWVRLLVKLLRHPDPLAPELARQALAYVETVADATAASSRPAARP